MPMLENLTFEEITVGQTASYSRTVTEDDLLREWRGLRGQAGVGGRAKQEGEGEQKSHRCPYSGRSREHWPQRCTTCSVFRAMSPARLCRRIILS